MLNGLLYFISNSKIKHAHHFSDTVKMILHHSISTQSLAALFTQLNSSNYYFVFQIPTF